MPLALASYSTPRARHDASISTITNQLRLAALACLGLRCSCDLAFEYIQPNRALHYHPQWLCELDTRLVTCRETPLCHRNQGLALSPGCTNVSLVCEAQSHLILRTARHVQPTSVEMICRFCRSLTTALQTLQQLHPARRMPVASHCTAYLEYTVYILWV